MSRKHIPNLITLLNLVSGSIAVIFAMSGNIGLAGWCIFIAAVFDFSDGLVARLLTARSEIGAQLDSLADMISFGLAPAVVMFQLMNLSVSLPAFAIGGTELFPFTSLLLVIGSAYRLAKFNSDPGQEYVFKGLPTPAMGLFIGALPIILGNADESSMIFQALHSYYFILAITIFLSWMMVSSIPMLSLKFKNLGLKENSPRYLLMFSLVILFIFFRFISIPLTILLYIIFSIAVKPADMDSPKH